MKHFSRLIVGGFATLFLWTPIAVGAITCLEAAQQSNAGKLISSASCVADAVANCTKQNGTPVQQSVQECGAGVCCAFIAPSDTQTGVSGTPSKDASVGIPCFPDPLQDGACVTTGSKVDFSSLIQRIISAVLSLVGALFFIMFLWGGVRYLTAGGDAENVKKAQKILVNAVIGMVIIGTSYALVTTIINAIAAGSAAK